MVFLYFSIVLLLFANKNNKAIYYAALILLLILFCLNTDNADRGIYENRLENYEYLTGLTEPGYYLWMSLFNNLHWDLQLQYVIVGLLYLSSLFYIVPKLSKIPNIVIGYYMIAIFFLDVVQLRATTSLIFVLWAFYRLLTISDIKRSILSFITLVIMGALFHSSALFFLVFAIIKIQNRKRLITIVIIGFAILLIVQYSLINYLGAILSVSDKIEAINQSDRYEGNNANLIVILLLIGMLFVYWSLFFLYGKKFEINSLTVAKNNIGIVLLLIIPLVSFSADFRRIYFAISPFLVATITNWMNKKNGFIISALILIWGGMFFYRFVIHGNYDAVFVPIMNENMIFDIL